MKSEMKRKLLLFLAIVSALVCVFATAVSAAEADEFGTPEIIPGMGEKSAFGEDGVGATFTSRVVMYDGEEYHTYPSYYIFANKTETELSFGEINDATGKGYSNMSVIRVEVPKNMLKFWDIFMNNNKLRYVYLPETVTVIGGNAFWACHSLEYVNVPRDCVSIENYAFIGCGKLTTLDMTEARCLKRTGDNNTFEGCKSLETLIFPDGFEHFGGASNVDSLKEIYFPASTKYIGTISWAKALNTVTIPFGVTTLQSNLFNYSPGIKTVVIHGGVTKIASDVLVQTNYVSKVIYTGSAEDEIVDSIKTGFPGATIVYGSLCDNYYRGEHLNDTNPCVINCERCGFWGVAKENPKHTEAVYVEYVSFDRLGARVTRCTSQGCGYEVSSELPPLFECRGYSVQEFGSLGITLGYTVNVEAIDDYEASTGNAFAYGVFAVSKAKLGTNDIFLPDGTVSNGVIKVDIFSRENEALEIKVIGIADAQKGAELAIGIYATVTKDGATEYFCMQPDTPTDGEKYSFVSYNSLTSAE